MSIDGTTTDNATTETATTAGGPAATGGGTPGAAPEIAVHLFAAAAAALGDDRVTVSGRTVAEVLAALAERVDADGRRVLERSSILVNSVVCTDRSRALAAGDRLDVLPPFAGG